MRRTSGHGFWTERPADSSRAYRASQKPSIPRLLQATPGQHAALAVGPRSLCRLGVARIAIWRRRPCPIGRSAAVDLHAGPAPCHDPDVNEDEASIEVPLVWPGADELVPQATNQFLAQLVTLRDGTPNELILIAGHVAQPVTLGSPQEQAAMTRALGAVAVKPVVKLSMTIERARELRDLLDRMVRRGAPGAPEGEGS